MMVSSSAKIVSGHSSTRCYSTLSVRLDPKTKNEVDEKCLSKNITASEFLRKAIEKELDPSRVWILLPDRLMVRLRTDVDNGTFIDEEEAIRFYLHKCMKIEDSEVLS